MFLRNELAAEVLQNIHISEEPQRKTGFSPECCESDLI